MSSLPVTTRTLPRLPDGGATGVAARVGADRRRRPTPMFSRYWLRGRRRGGRRAGEVHRIYVDGYTRAELALVFTLVTLSGLDLVLTLGHLAAGGEEANPIMAWTLNGGGMPGFVAGKIGLTVLAALVFLTHVRFPLARRGLWAGVLVYAGLMVWHGVVVVDRSGLG